MSHHPSLNEVLENDCDYEWLDLSIESLTIKDWANSSGRVGNISEMQFFILCGHCSSEYGTYSFQNTRLQITADNEETIQNLTGNYPLGSINYYADECPTINLNITEKLYNHIFPFIVRDLSGLRVRITIPDWADKEAKCLPLTDYQVFYEYSTKI